MRLGLGIDPGALAMLCGIPSPAARPSWLDGAAAGSPGTLPAAWSVSYNPDALDFAVSGIGAENGAPTAASWYLELTVSGTYGSGQTLQFGFSEQFAAVGQTWRASFLARFMANAETGAGSSAGARMNAFDAGRGYLDGFEAGFVQPAPAAPALATAATWPIPAGDAPAALITGLIVLKGNVGDDAGCRLRIFAPSLAQL